MAQPAQNSPGAEVDSVQEAIEVQPQEAIEVQAQERIEVQPQELIKTPPGVEVNSVQEPIAQATETSPVSKSIQSPRHRSSRSLAASSIRG